MEKARIGKPPKRETKETCVDLEIHLDGRGEADVASGIPFFDHMLTLFAQHGFFDLKLKAEGDLEVDYHHTVEDVGIVMGQGLSLALGERRGIRRYGFFILPMDEVLVRVAMDLSKRPYLRWDVKSPVRFVRDFNIQLFQEFFRAVSVHAGANIHIALEYGEEPHHIAEGIFKGFARALDMATAVEPRWEGKPVSTKGVL